MDERRRYKRLPVPGGTVALDAEGRMLGTISFAGGGGMQIENLSEDGKRELHPGRRLRITVVEPAIEARHTAEVEVRFQKEGRAGVEFSTGKGQHA